VKKKILAHWSLRLALISGLAHLVAFCFIFVGWQNVRALGDEFTGRNLELALSSHEVVAFAFDIGGNLIALVGLVCAVIATKRRQWGPVLIAAWILNVLGSFVSFSVLTIEPVI